MVGRPGRLLALGAALFVISATSAYACRDDGGCVVPSSQPPVSSTSTPPPSGSHGQLILFGSDGNCNRDMVCGSSKPPVASTKLAEGSKDRRCKTYMMVEIDGAQVRECRKYEDE